MIRSFAASLLALALVPLSGPAHAQSAASPAPWLDLVPPEGGFSVKMPKAPERQVGEIPAGQGGPGRTVIYTTVGDGMMFLAGWADYAPSFKFDDQAELAANRDNFVSGLGATLLASRAITMNGAPGLEFDLAKPGVIAGRARVYIVKGKPYQFAFLNRGEQLDTATATRFFSAIRFVPKR